MALFEVGKRLGSKTAWGISDRRQKTVTRTFRIRSIDLTAVHNNSEFI